MTPEELDALFIFVNMVKEMSDAEKQAQELISASDPVDNITGHFQAGLLETIRTGYSQEELDNLVATITEQEDPKNA